MYNMALNYQHEWLDDERYPNRFRQDAKLTATFTAKPADRVRLRTRFRYLFEDISDNTFLEQSVWAYFDIAYRLRDRDKLRLRYDFVKRLDKRDSTMDRVPNPEHWLWIEYESRF